MVEGIIAQTRDARNWKPLIIAANNFRQSAQTVEKALLSRRPKRSITVLLDNAYSPDLST